MCNLQLALLNLDQIDDINFLAFLTQDIENTDGFDGFKNFRAANPAHDRMVNTIYPTRLFELVNQPDKRREKM